MEKFLKNLMISNNVDDPKDLVENMPKLWFGHWEVETSLYIIPSRFILCKCACGKTKTVAKSDLKSGKTKSCGCKKTYKKQKIPKSSMNLLNKTLLRYNATDLSDLANRFEFLEFGYWKVSSSEYIQANKKIHASCICGVSKICNRNELDLGHSRSCGCQMTELQKQTSLEKYGCEFSSQDPGVMKKIQQTNLAKHGHVCTLHSVEISQKIKEDNMIKYGVDRPIKLKSVQDTIKKTNLLRYGYESPLMSPEIKEKIRISSLISYGYENPFESPVIQEQIKRTNLEKYGYENASQSPLIREKVRKAFADKDDQSDGEKEVRDWISSFGILAEKSYFGGLIPGEIDMLIRSHGIAIEFNGEYWHSESEGRDEFYHIHKTIETKRQKNCQLIHVFEMEWIKRQDQVKYLLLGKLFKGIPISARKCEIRPIDKEISHTFCDQYYLKGSPDSSTFSVGLYYNNEMLSVMILNELELVRFVTKPNYRIHGGLSKMSQYLHSRLGYFITYIDKRLNSSDSFIKSGYIELETFSPDYWYWNDSRKIMIHKDQFIKSKKLHKVWDCGKIKMMFNNKGVL